jgi:hypothetical protein
VPYRKWFLSSCGTRRARFRFNSQISDPKLIPVGNPQGSPLSPYLFGLYVSSITGPDRISIDTPSTSRLLAGYVDDFVLSIAARTQAQLEKFAKISFEELVEREERIQLSFSTRKWRTSHQVHGVTWAAAEGMEVTKAVRVLGYWWENGKVGRYPWNHWMNRARHAVHVIRSASTVHNIGPKTRPLQRLLTACVRRKRYMA